MEEGETLEAAILREVQEETGLRHLCIERFLADYIIHVKEKRNIKTPFLPRNITNRCKR